ncbi:MAG: GMC family oxidoreductase N-terminal domain-containing protein, partial [Firmicutes bacterium]|nr:GMC family oxidoreductase N-terminal domain-containing protein [Bacillota bacterium]
MKVWDYIIIGAGSAGCVLANKLSESGKQSVLLIEAGDKNNAIGLKIPAGISHARTIAKNDWGYNSEPDPTRYNRIEQWLRGRVVGGSSSINGMMYVRGNTADYDRWSAMGNTGWASKDIMPLFKSLECSDKVSDIRGNDGLLKVKTVKGAHPVTDAFIEASQTAGYAVNNDFNGECQEGVGYAELTQRGGLRCSAADAFLKPALKRKNLTLYVNAYVHKLLITNNCVSGVRYESKNKTYEARSRRVVLCGGAINSPQLLMLSGIGDTA